MSQPDAGDQDDGRQRFDDEEALVRSYRNYAELLIERQRILQDYAPGSTIEVKTWAWKKTATVRRKNGLLLTDVSPADVERRGEFVRWGRTAKGVGVWRTLRPLAFGAGGREGSGSSPLVQLCDRHPLQRTPQVAEEARDAYLAGLEVAIDQVCDEIAQLCLRSHLPVPWGEGQPRSPKSQDAFERVCRVLRDRDPDPRAKHGVAAMMDRVPFVQPESGQRTHSSDFTSVIWDGVRYTFSKGQQAEAVKVLWREYEKGGLGLSEKTIGELIWSNSDRFRLRDVFRRKSVMHPAWKTMVVEAGKGIYALAPPTDR